MVCVLGGSDQEQHRSLSQALNYSFVRVRFVSGKGNHNFCALMTRLAHTIRLIISDRFDSRRITIYEILAVRAIAKAKQRLLSGINAAPGPCGLYISAPLYPL